MAAVLAAAKQGHHTIRDALGGDEAAAVKPEPFPKPTWSVPTPYGYDNAATIAGSVGAPLLAGFTVSLIGIVIGYGSNMLAPGVGLVLLSAAAVVLLGSVQLCFKARMYFVTPAEIESWWPDHDDNPRRDQLLREQSEHVHLYRVWSRRFRWTYNTGLLLLLAGVAVILMPPAHHHVVERWVATGIVAAGFLAELSWLVGDWAEGLGKQWWRLR